VLVLMDAPADAIFSPIEPNLFRLGQVALVRGHVFLFPCLQAGFAVLQVAGFFRAQGAVLDAVGNAILLPGFATVYLIHPGMARIDNTRSSGRGRCCGLGNGGTGEHQPTDCQDQERVRDFVDHICVNPHRRA
jgi:hypothetical protein